MFGGNRNSTGARELIYSELGRQHRARSAGGLRRRLFAFLGGPTRREGADRSRARLSPGFSRPGNFAVTLDDLCGTHAVATPMDMGLRLAGRPNSADSTRRRTGRGPTFSGKCSSVLPGRIPPTDNDPLDGPPPRHTRSHPPVIGPSKTATNVWYGFGHGHMGLTWGPSTGRLISEMMAGARSNIDLPPFRADRFSGCGTLTRSVPRVERARHPGDHCIKGPLGFARVGNMQNTDGFIVGLQSYLRVKRYCSRESLTGPKNRFWSVHKPGCVAFSLSVIVQP